MGFQIGLQSFATTHKTPLRLLQISHCSEVLLQHLNFVLLTLVSYLIRTSVLQMNVVEFCKNRAESIPTHFAKILNIQLRLFLQRLRCSQHLLRLQHFVLLTLVSYIIRTSVLVTPLRLLLQRLNFIVLLFRFQHTMLFNVQNKMRNFEDNISECAPITERQDHLRSERLFSGL